MAGLGTVVVLAHLVVVGVHGHAHSELGIELNTLQKAFAVVVIVVAPPVAAALLWTRWRFAGFSLLLASMAGSLLFGVYHHYLLVSPDHVSHLPPGDAQGLFRVSSLLLPITEAVGLVVGLWGTRISKVDCNRLHRGR